MVLRSESGLYNWPGIQEKTLSYPANSISLTLKTTGLGSCHLLPPSWLLAIWRFGGATLSFSFAKKVGFLSWNVLSQQI
jgi:hypothetical protein